MELILAVLMWGLVIATLWLLFVVLGFIIYLMIEYTKI